MFYLSALNISAGLGCYGSGYIKSPNIDRLAQSGLVFTNHFPEFLHVAHRVAAFLTGMYPPQSAFVQ